MPPNRWLKLAVLVALPCVLYLLIAERMSWIRPEILATTGGEVYTLAFSPDGKLLASGTMQHTTSTVPVNTVQFWDISSQKIVRTLKPNAVRGKVFFLPGGNVLACADIRNRDGSMRLYEVKTGKLLRTLASGSHMFSLSPDGKTLASQSEKEWNVITLWDFKTMRRKMVLRDTDWVYDTAFSPDGKLLASYIFDQSSDLLQLWDVKTGRRIRTLPDSRIALSDVTFSPDGKQLFGTGYDTIHTWDVSTSKPRGAFQDGIKDLSVIAFSRDGSLIAAGTRENAVNLWHVKTGKLLRTMQMQRSPGASILSLAFSPDGSILACGGSEGHISLWRIK